MVRACRITVEEKYSHSRARTLSLGLWQVVLVAFERWNSNYTSLLTLYTPLYSIRAGGKITAKAINHQL